MPLGLHRLKAPRKILQRIIEKPFDYGIELAETEPPEDSDKRDLETVSRLANEGPFLTIESVDRFARLLQRVVGSIKYSRKHLDIFVVNNFYLQDEAIYKELSRKIRDTGDFEYFQRLDCLSMHANLIRGAVQSFTGQLRIVLQPIDRAWIDAHTNRLLKHEDVEHIWRLCLEGQSRFFLNLLDTYASRATVYYSNPPDSPGHQDKRRILATDQEIFSQPVSVSGPGILSPTTVRWIGHDPMVWP